MKNILIIGSGFIGRSMYEFLKKRYSNDYKNGNIYILNKHVLDYTNTHQFLNYLSIRNITDVVCCVGYTGKPNVDACESDKQNCYHYNVEVPQQILSSIRTQGDHIRFLHISSGCIYDRYDKEYTETDEPNFGIFNDNSSWYSKTKHISETILKQDTNTAILRIRIPFCGDQIYKNYIVKLLNYDNLIDFRNSKTSIDLIGNVIDEFTFGEKFHPGIFNVVNSDALTTTQVLDIIKSYNYNNPNWKIVPYESLKIKANRSNCVLSNQKLKDVGIYISSEEDALNDAMQKFPRK